MVNLPEVELKKQVEDILGSIRGLLLLEGAAVELVEVTDREVFVRLVGDCQQYPSSTLAVKQAVERAIKDVLPQIERVVQV